MYGHLGQSALSLAPVRGLSRLTNAERYKLIQVAENVGANPDILAAVISLETAGTFDPAIQNPSTRATGLIQFIPATARSLGTSTEALKAMTVCQQFDFVEAFYKRVARGGIRIPGDEYVAVFAPNFQGRAGGTVVYSRGQPGYDQNRGLDTNGDGIITVSELRQNVLNRVPVGRTPITVTPESCGAGGFGRGSLLPILAVVGVGAAIFWGTLQPVRRAV
jgi:hypothetical protein